MRAIPVLRWLVLTLGLTVQGTIAQQEQLEVLIAEALSRHPRLEALTARTAAQRHGEAPAAAMPDPTLRLDLLNVPLGEWNLDSSPMSGRQLGLVQQLPWPGRRAADRRVASTQTQIVATNTHHEAARIVDAVKQAFFELILTDEAMAITTRNQNLVRDYVRMAQAKYAVGTGRLQDILKAQVFQSSLGDRLLQLRARRRIAEARLNALRARPIETPLVSARMMPATHLPYELPDLVQMAIASRPALEGQRQQIEHWRAVEEVARLSARPDINLNIAYRQRSFDTDPVAGADIVSAGISLRLPLWRHQREHEQGAAARQRQRASVADLAAMELEIELQLQELLVKAQLHHGQMALLREAILPQARQSLTAAVAGYRVDHVDFGALLDSHVSLQQFEIELHHHHIDYEKTLARLEAVVGVRLF